MKGQFDIQTLGDFSGKNCLRYSNLFFPFSDFNKTDGLFDNHLELAHEFTSTQYEINNFIESWKNAILKIDKEIGKYLENYNPAECNTFNRTNPSFKLKEEFKKVIELCAMRLQDVARLCLQISNQPEEILSKSNLVNEFEKLLRKVFSNDISIIEMLDKDSDWIVMLKDLRNEAGRHEGGDKANGRKLIFHKIEVSFLNGPGVSPTLQLPAFEFNGKKGIVHIDNFEEIFDTLMNNIFELSIDWLILAYSYKTGINYSFLTSLIRNKFITENTRI